MSGRTILRLDAAGNPRRWIDAEKAAYYIAKDLVLWSLGSTQQVLRGGYNDKGLQTLMPLPSILAVRGRVIPLRGDETIPLEKAYLLKRDRCMCAYCGEVFREEDLQMEHIQPESRGGALSWTNIVASCGSCNSRKGNRTPEEAKMPLLYVPYVPNMHEGLILQGRKLSADQMDFLLSGVPKSSRLFSKLQ